MIRWKGLIADTGWNIVGQVVPLTVAVIAIPILDQSLGTDRYGLLLIAWMFVGYFSLFDLGLGRALTYLIAQRRETTREHEISALIWTALSAVAGISVIVAVSLAIAAPVLANSISLRISASLQPEVKFGLFVLAVSVPFVASTAALRGVMEAYARFDIANLIRVPLGVFTFAGPLLLLPFTHSLGWILVLLTAGRIAAWGVHVVWCGRIVPGLYPIRLERRFLRTLVRFGGWMTVSNIISPLMVYMDRLLITVVLTASAVAYYATPWEVVTKFLMLPAALMVVLFPSFSSWKDNKPELVSTAYRLSIHTLGVALLVVLVPTIIFAEPSLELWLGAAYAQNSTPVAKILCVGVLLNGVASVPFAMLQGHGRSDLTAKAHLVEFPVYVLLLLGLLNLWGIVGAALAWTIRVALDLVFLMIMANRELRLPGRIRSTMFASVLSGAAIAVAALAPGPVLLVFPVIMSLVFVHAVTVWTRVFTQSERSLFRSRIPFF